MLSIEESKADKIVLKEETLEIKWSEGITNIILFLFQDGEASANAGAVFFDSGSHMKSQSISISFA